MKEEVSYEQIKTDELRIVSAQWAIDRLQHDVEMSEDETDILMTILACLLGNEDS